MGLGLARILFEGAGTVAARSDADLVRIFLTGHGETSEAAFEALVVRHGPMVLATCRRALGRDEHAAEDAFQAVFLILANRARSVRVDDSLGRWLRGVARRVAVRARHTSIRQVSPPAVAREAAEDPVALAVRREARRAIDLEVTRLPRKYRDAVTLHHLDGLSHDQVAEALGLPVGTVRSRLSRARDLLRSRLVRRGLAPAAVAACLAPRPSTAAVPPMLLETTLRLGRAGGPAAVAASPVAIDLARRTLGSFRMMKAIGAMILAGTLGSLTIGAYVAAGGGDPPSPRDAPAAAAVPPKEGAVPIEDPFQQIIREFEDAKARAEAGLAGLSDFERSRSKKLDELPDEAPYAHRIVELAMANPKEKAARDALIWVMDTPARTDTGRYGDEYGRAVDLLVAHHADDPEVARLGLRMSNQLSRHRDAFLEGIYACAEGREAKGLARMAVAQYMEKKAAFSESARNHPGRSFNRYQAYDESGKLVWKQLAMPNQEEGYRAHLRMLDPAFLRAESERLYGEVVADYADVPYITTAYRKMEREARETPSSKIADPKRKERMIAIEKALAEKPPTLGAMAAARLDDIRNLALGKPAPDFEGTGADGRPVKLSDFRGKVVVLAYWFSSCGPCLRAIPDEKALVARMKGRPFTLVGVVSDGLTDEARKVIASHGIDWPNVLTGGDKVAARYHVASNPAYFVIDAGGTIRAKGQRELDAVARLAEQLVGEAEAKGR